MKNLPISGKYFQSVPITGSDFGPGMESKGRTLMSLLFIAPTEREQGENKFKSLNSVLHNRFILR